MENRLSYEEIEPLCKWRKEAEQEVLEVCLQGFKKEQLRVQINSRGILTISGESAADGNRPVRFCKELNIHKDCKKDQIRAKFSCGTLFITMPKTTTQTQPTQTDQPIQESGEPNQNVDKDKRPAATAGTAARLSMLSKPTDFISGLNFSVPRLHMGGKTVLKLGVLAAVVAAAAAGGSYVAYKYRQAFHVED